MRCHGIIVADRSSHNLDISCQHHLSTEHRVHISVGVSDMIDFHQQDEHVTHVQYVRMG
jgi:hypothetical protein